jgi:hypothetical protein
MVVGCGNFFGRNCLKNIMAGRGNPAIWRKEKMVWDFGGNL